MDNLIYKYAENDWMKKIIFQRVVHSIPGVWNNLSRYGLEYEKTKTGKYFPTNIHIIGIGAFSVVYSIQNTNYILKITNHSGEIDWSEQIQSLQSINPEYKENYVEIFNIVNSNIKSNVISSDYDDMFKCSFIILEKLYPLSDNELNDMRLFDEKMYKDIGCRFEDEWIDYDSIINYVEDIQISNEPLAPNILNIVNKYIQLGRDVEQFDWKDFHLKNLMVNKNGNYKFIDLQSN